MQEGYESLDEMIPRINEEKLIIYLRCMNTVWMIPIILWIPAVVDHLDDLTDIDVSRDILASA